MKRLLFMLLAATALFACSKGEDSPPEPTLSVNPSTAILFTAAATETFTISVATNQPTWKVESSQAWCKVVAAADRFTVSADPNTSITAPTPAVITVTAGAKSVSVDVTQQGATLQYPTNETELKQAISKVWLFPDGADYLSLEFTAENTYTLLSNTPFTKASNNIYLLSGTYIIANDLHEFTLSDFGKIHINAFGLDSLQLTVTPTQGTAYTVKLAEQKIIPAPTSTAKKIKKIESINEEDGNASIEFYYANGKLSSLTFQGEEMTLDIPIHYDGTQLWYEMEGEAALGKPGIFKVTYRLNSAGLAQSSVIQHKGTVVSTVYYTYDNQRQLISWRQTDQLGKFEAFCNATWLQGNVASIYMEKAHTCDDSYDEYEGVKYYRHDHNENGFLDDNDVVVQGGVEKYTRTYSYSDKLNKGGYMYTIMMPEIFCSSDFFDQIGQWIGVLGVSCKNVMSEDESGVGDITYIFDSEGYPTQINVSYPETPADNWFLIQTYQ